MDRTDYSGQAHSLWGHIKPSEMGSRATRERPNVIGERPNTRISRNTHTSELLGTSYRPKTKETTVAWEYLLSFLQIILGGDQPRDILANAAEECLSILKDENLRDLDRKEKIEGILGRMENDKFAQIVNLGKKVTDWAPTKSVEQNGISQEEDDSGVAVVFEEEDENELIDTNVDEEDENELQIPILKSFEEQLTDANFDDSNLSEGAKEDNNLIDVDGEDLHEVDLELLAFPQGGHTMTNKKCVIPENSVRVNRAGYEEIHIPAPTPKPLQPGETLIEINSLPEWTWPAFTGVTTLNRIQSKLHTKALLTDENFLLCAPTGAGKTNVALLAMLREIGKHISNIRANNNSALSKDEKAFKIVYVAPMKALVQEMVNNFKKKLAPYGLHVAELTGDQHLTRTQISETHVLVTTPEKWDVITRKNNETSYTRLVRLLIIDEIHLLHDDRGPVLEAIIARTLRQAEETQEWTRIVGLSATLPNYIDVGRFLRVDGKNGIFYFDSSYRPCPLAQQYVGVYEKKPLKRMQLMNEIVYEKVMERAVESQVLVFVHSRKDTAKTAKSIRDGAMTRGTVAQLLKGSEASRDALSKASESVVNPDLKDLLPYGFAIHHAGLTRSDRNIVEELFANGHAIVLISTATLAWGVNLPAHTVIIKGTQVYNPEKGRWCELSSQDVLQMLGRAGRPQYDTQGEGIIITTQSELQFYLSLLNQQLPIESQFVNKLVDHLNAEIVLGTIKNRNDAVEWLGYTYHFVRMLREPLLYGVAPESLQSDPYLRKRRASLIHSAAIVLEKANLIRYDRRSGIFKATELARIASHFYVGHYSMSTYNQHLRPATSEIDLFRIFSLSQEFKLIPVRQEEKLELQKLGERVPIPIRENFDEPAAKINILLQSYISQLKLEGFALAADMVYVTQSAGRILRALFEISLKRGWAQISHSCLELCKMVEKRTWRSMTPLRQLHEMVPIELLRKLERKDFPWEQLFGLNPQEIGELIRTPKAGKTLYQALRYFPRVHVDAQVVPLTRETLRIDVSIKNVFEWNESVHSRNEPFLIMVEDVDGENILFNDRILLKPINSEEPIELNIYVSFGEVIQPAYFVTVVSERWLGCRVRVPVILEKLILPEKKTTPCDVISPEEASSLEMVPFSSYSSISESYKAEFSDIQRTCYPALFKSDENLFIGASSSFDRLACAEFAIWRALIQSDPNFKCVFIAPNVEILDEIRSRWVEQLKWTVSMLTGDSVTDLRIIEAGGIILSTPSAFDQISRRWKSRKSIQLISLFIVYGLNWLSFDPTIEIILSRVRFMSEQLEGHKKLRIISLSVPLWNTKEINSWLGVSSEGSFNFDPSFLLPFTAQLEVCDRFSHPPAVLEMIKKSFIKEPVPLESSLDTKLSDHFNAEIAAKTISSKQDAVDYLTWTLLYRRLARNPNYYGISSLNQLAISEYLSSLVEETINELVVSKCISIDEEEKAEEGGSLTPLNLGLIAAYYGIRCISIEMLAMSLSSEVKIRDMLQCLSSAAEFDDVIIREKEESILGRLAEIVRYKPNGRVTDPHIKVFLLLQAHFSRISLPPQLEDDRKIIVIKVLPLIQACVDVLSSFGYLKSAILTMELSQMLIQALWNNEPPIKQLPHFEGELLKLAIDSEKTSVYDLDEGLLKGVPKAWQVEIAEVANKYPSIELEFGLDTNSVELGEDLALRSAITRQGALGPVRTNPLYPLRKEESWWLIVSFENVLLGIKKFIITGEKMDVSLKFSTPQTVGKIDAKVYLICDSYIGADQEFDLQFNVEQPSQ